VPLEWLSCKPTRGGRWLWRCPACGRRCWKLFGSADRPFRCIDCQGLGHRSKKEKQPWQRLLRFARQTGVPLAGGPRGGMVPPSIRTRRYPLKRGLQQSRLRDRLRAAIAAELLRED
jgi:hypothetical protein